MGVVLSSCRNSIRSTSISITPSCFGTNSICKRSLTRIATNLLGLTSIRSIYRYSILKDGGIIPQISLEGYKLSEIAATFKAALGMDPYLQCFELKVGFSPAHNAIWSEKLLQ